MATETIQKPKPEIEYPWGPQFEFVTSDALFELYQTGQGGGKTLAGCFKVRQYVKQHPGAIFICTEPTYPMVRDILKIEFDRQFSEAGEFDKVTWRASEHKYVLVNGSEIWLRQCDKADALRGPSVAGVWMDEAAQSPHSAFQILVGRMRQRGYPHLFLCTGTPRGHNWLHWVFAEGERPEDAPPFIGDALKDELPDVRVDAFFASSLDNPYLDPVTRAALQAAYEPGTLLYRQEVGGETVVFEGLIYTQFRFAQHVRELPPGQKFVRVVLGQDWGWTNPGALLVLGLGSHGEVWLLAEVYDTHKDIDWWAGQARGMAGPWGADLKLADAVFCDPSEPGNIAKLVQHGLPALPAENAVIPGITMVGSAFAQDQLLITPSCVKTIGELQSYSWKRRRVGGIEEIRKDEPEKVNDHAMDALRYGIMGLFTQPVVRQTIQLVEPVRI